QCRDRADAWRRDREIRGRRIAHAGGRDRAGGADPGAGQVMRLLWGILALMGGGLVASPVLAQTVEEFYAGRQISIVVGFNPGGAYDPYARAVARHLPRHLPGAPTIVIKNMQGAGSVIAANYLYNVAPRDGSELGVVAGGAALEPVYGKKTAQF